MCIECNTYTKDFELSTEELELMVDQALKMLAWSELAWVTGGEEPDNLDTYMTENDSEWDAESVTGLRESIEGFLSMAADELEESELTLGQIAHDLVLTANGHGAGFWDRGLGAVGDKLTECAKSFSFETEVGDDGKVYIS